ncbi:hypothetical protein [Ureibacillus acetophenoni]|uniref:Uncharacterized protein n=1 Tax=Ureibacillus acetophenoni TaxID=614649 RepID=A0A285ULG1_9BACL|nr:hypothetical protein [Ureibacillus acetophenoni]SOC42527.1 hypothetical protein SAMN05877842_11322 [Ureibacillus acetophenoni]
MFGIVLILFLLTFLIINNSLSNVTRIQLPVNSVEDYKKEFEEIENLLYGDPGVMNKVNSELLENGYAFQATIAGVSLNDIQVKIVLYNNEATEEEQEKVKTIFYEIIKEYNLDPNAFSLVISDK